MSTNGEMQLILGTTPESNWHAISELFELAGWTVSHNKSKACYENAKENALAGGRFILLHSHPVEAIAHAVVYGATPEQAKEAWLTAAKEMVDFYTKHRDQSVLVYIPNLLAEPKAQLATIEAHLRLKDGFQVTIAVEAEQAPLLERMLASQLLQQNPEITDLLARIEACTIPQEGLSYKASALDFNAANRQLASLRASHKKSELLAEMTLQTKKYQEENDLMLNQLHLVQEKLEAKYLSYDQLNEQLMKSKVSEREIAEHRDQKQYALAVVKRQNQNLKAELKSFQSSTTFKAKSILRSLSEKFRSTGKATLKKQVELIEQSGIFNEGWYLTTYPDVADKNIDPIVHYLNFGAAEHRNPGPEFDTRWYLSSYPDVAEVNMNPALHYSLYGKNEGRQTCSDEDQSRSLARAA